MPKLYSFFTVSLITATIAASPKQSLAKADEPALQSEPKRQIQYWNPERPIVIVEGATVYTWTNACRGGASVALKRLFVAEQFPAEIVKEMSCNGKYYYGIRGANTSYYIVLQDETVPLR